MIAPIATSHGASSRRSRPRLGNATTLAMSRGGPVVSTGWPRSARSVSLTPIILWTGRKRARKSAAGRVQRLRLSGRPHQLQHPWLCLPPPSRVRGTGSIVDGSGIPSVSLLLYSTEQALFRSLRLRKIPTGDAAAHSRGAGTNDGENSPAAGRHGLQLRAFSRGIWHGLTGNIAARYRGLREV